MEETPFLSRGSLRSKTWHLSRFGLHVEVTLPERFPVDHLVAFSLASSGSARGGNTIKSCEETEAHCFLLAELEHTPWSLCSLMRDSSPAQCSTVVIILVVRKTSLSCLSVFSGGFLNLRIFKGMVEIVACGRFIENSSVSSQSA